MPPESERKNPQTRGARWPGKYPNSAASAGRQPAWHAFTGEARGITPRLSAATIFRNAESHLIPSHQHPDYELMLVVAGKYRCNLNGASVNLRQWEGVLIKPGDWHEDTCEWPVALFVLRFDIVSAWGGVPPPVFQPPQPVSRQLFKCSLRIRQSIKELGEEIARNDPFAFPLQTALLRSIFWQVLRALPQEGISMPFLDAVREQGLARQLMRYFHGRIDSVMSVPGMARELGMSESSLAHKCKEALGVSPIRAFQHCKMEHARELLENTTMSCKEIAAHLGFDEPAHFTRAFKRAFSKAPAIWRRSCSPG